MQEEVENRTINLAISTTRLTARSIIAGIRKYLQHREKVKARKGTRDTAVHGKQSVKQLLGQNQGATNVEIDKDGIRDFERLAKKYGVDFAVRKDKSVDPPRYLVFVRSKDADALRGVRPFLSDKYDLTQHPNYKYTSDFDKKNEFNIEQFLSRRLKLKAGDEFVVVDAD